MKRKDSIFVEKIKIRKILSVGDLIDIELPHQHIVGNSRIMSLDFNNKMARILIPVYKNSKIKLRVGEFLNIRIYENSSNIMIKSRVLKAKKEDIIIYLPSVGVKIQKRLFYRIPIIREGILKSVEENKLIPFETRDFSAGGMQVVVKEELDMEKKYTIKDLNIDKKLKLNEILCRVVRFVGENVFGEKYYGIRFCNIDYKTEKSIVRFVNLYTIKAKHGSIGE
ncbi:MAG: hypothetical protein B6I29_02305 [Marinitoga sp. 4572_148]|nr:MAG: hypothetical protein B6I29_02305 [Marinitoga sp. 4572_148]